MPCSWIRLPNGTIVHIRHSNPRRRRCRFCSQWSTQLCDFPMGNGKTCGSPCCAQHSVRIGEDQDYCELHRNSSPQKFFFEGTE